MANNGLFNQEYRIPDKLVGLGIFKKKKYKYISFIII